MTNPAPRPALRKAPDADVHPASPSAPRHRQIDVRTAPPPPAPLAVDRREIDLRSRQTSVTDSETPAAAALASDHVVGHGDTDAEGGTQVAKKSNKKSNKKSSSKKKDASKKKDKKKKKGKGKKKKGKGKKSGARAVDRIDLRTSVPASVRRTLRTGAKARGTSVEGTVDSVLTGWQPDTSN